MRANPTLIGLFVVGGVVLGVIAILLFGSGEYFEEKERYILFFSEPVNGLVPGSPVKMSGVKIGEVEEVRLTYEEKTDEFRTPVTIVVFPSTFTGVDLGKLKPKDAELRTQWIARGFRATLSSESLITGQLGIALGFHPDSEAVFVGGDLPYPELPTTTTGLSKFLQDVETLPLKELITDLHGTIRSIDARVNSEEVTRLLNSASETIEEFGRLGRKVNERIDPVADRLEAVGEGATDLFVDVRKTLGGVEESVAGISAELEETLRTVRKLSSSADTELVETTEDFRETMESARTTLSGLNAAALQATQLLSGESKTLVEVRRALAEFAGASRAMKNLAETLQRQPESLLRGKQGD